MNRSVNIYLVKRGFPQSSIIYYFENGFRKWVDYFSTKKSTTYYSPNFLMRCSPFQKRFVFMSENMAGP